MLETAASPGLFTSASPGVEQQCTSTSPEHVSGLKAGILCQTCFCRKVGQEEGQAWDQEPVSQKCPAWVGKEEQHVVSRAKVFTLAPGRAWTLPGLSAVWPWTSSLVCWGQDGSQGCRTLHGLVYLEPMRDGGG